MHSVWTKTSSVIRGQRRDCRAVLFIRARLMLFCLVLSAVPLGHARAQTPASAGASVAPASVRDANVRQVVLGIVSFTRWPTPPARVRLCVVGQTDYTRELLAPQGASSSAPGAASNSTPPVDAHRVSAAEPAIGSLCDALYLGAVSDAERRQVLASLAGHAVLTISERNDSCTLGTMFCLNVDAERVTFDINLDTVARSGVRVHPNVLKLARKPGTP
ncbi:YfiR family protein [Pandoraea captiosa]|uniref:YfiR family protein n=1 Tax=Pandoraea captiosa TaxID=2508302 RepID=UPI001FE8A2E9|nr:YfiR family protein [Pandoraea captiosa]